VERIITNQGASRRNRKHEPPVSKDILKAFASYQAETTPAAIRKSVSEMKTLGIPQTAADIRWSAAMTLRDAVEKETHLLGDSAGESAVRARAGRMGYAVSKSRDRSLHSNNRGQFRLCDDRNTVVLGDGFDAPLQDVADYLTEKAA
jgi:hypothetical protein